jgi:hypothetical protein
MSMNWWGHVKLALFPAARAQYELQARCVAWRLRLRRPLTSSEVGIESVPEIRVKLLKDRRELD